MIESVILSAALIFVARVINIAISALRTLFMTRGMKSLAVVFGFFEALLFAVTISQVVQDLGNVWNLAGYSAGFAAGLLLGMIIEDRLAIGYVTVNVVSSHHARELAEAIREAGFGATESRGQGSEGEVGIVRVVVARRKVEEVSEIANRVDPGCFLTVEPTMTVRRGYLGFIEVRT